MRPKEDITSMPNNWYNDILEMYKNGASDVEIKALIYEWRGTFSNDLWERWIKESLEFSETIKTGKILSEAWWIRNGRVNLQNKEFNYTGWYMQMKNRFNWTDRVDNTTKGNEINNRPQIIFADESKGKSEVSEDLDD